MSELRVMILKGIVMPNKNPVTLQLTCAGKNGQISQPFQTTGYGMENKKKNDMAGAMTEIVTTQNHILTRQ